jgi:CheY-like chemotaxis protein
MRCPISATDTAGGNATELGRRDLAGLRVLVVEDAWHVAKALKAALEDMKMIVVGPAAGIANAEMLIEMKCPDLAVVDINLKGEMAYGLINHLRHNGVRVVVITGYAVLTHPACKGAVVLQKPFTGRSLIEALHRAAGI